MLKRKKDDNRQRGRGKEYIREREREKEREKGCVWRKKRMSMREEREIER